MTTMSNCDNAMMYFYLFELRTTLSYENYTYHSLPCKKVGYVLPPPTPPLLHCFNPIIWKQNRTGDNNEDDMADEEEDNEDEME